MQAAKAALSSEHSKLAVVSGELKLKLALEDVLGLLGEAVMLVSGAVVSTVQLKLAGVASTFPAASLARTWKVCEPSVRPV